MIYQIIDSHRNLTKKTRKALTDFFCEVKGLQKPDAMRVVDEAFSALCALSVGERRGKLIFYNICSFWEDARDMLKHMREKGFLREDSQHAYAFADTPEEVLKLLEVE